MKSIEIKWSMFLKEQEKIKKAKEQNKNKGGK